MFLSGSLQQQHLLLWQPLRPLRWRALRRVRRAAAEIGTETAGERTAAATAGGKGENAALGHAKAVVGMAGDGNWADNGLVPQIWVELLNWSTTIWLVVSNIFYVPWYMGCHPSHWRSYFSRWLKPPTSYVKYAYNRTESVLMHPSIRAHGQLPCSLGCFTLRAPKLFCLASAKGDRGRSWRVSLVN